MGQTLAPIMASWEVWLVLLASWGRSSGSFSGDDVILLDSGDALLDDDDDNDGPLLSTPISISLILLWTSSLSPISLSLSLKHYSHFIPFFSPVLWRSNGKLRIVCLFVCSLFLLNALLDSDRFGKTFTFNIQRTWEFSVLFLLFFGWWFVFLRIKCKILTEFVLVN